LHAHRHLRAKLAVVAAVATAAVGVSAGLPDHRAAAAAATTTPVVAAGPARFGLVDNGLLTDTDAQLEAALANANTLGVTWIRAQLSWNATEPTRGVYNWQPFDRLVAAANAHHLSVLTLVDFTPPWARPAGCALWSCAPSDPDAFAAFAKTAAARYAPANVHTWEIWNEPNLKGFWSPTPSASAYGTLLKATAGAIRSVDPNAFIISGGLAPAADANGNISPVTFLSGVCSAGGLAAVDAVGDHPYSYPVLPTYPAAWNAWQQMNATPLSLRSVMTGCGAGAKGIWATEYGAPTNGPGALATATNLNLVNHPDHVDEAFQATMVTTAVSAAKAADWLDAVFVYDARDIGTSTTTNENFFGLRRYDGTPKPAWTALQAALATP
jgi:hypothetical protein